MDTSQLMDPGAVTRGRCTGEAGWSGTTRTKRPKKRGGQHRRSTWHVAGGGAAGARTEMRSGGLRPSNWNQTAGRRQDQLRSQRNGREAARNAYHASHGRTPTAREIARSSRTRCTTGLNAQGVHRAERDWTGSGVRGCGLSIQALVCS
jgi:hypothetical protein